MSDDLFPDHEDGEPAAAEQKTVDAADPKTQRRQRTKQIVDFEHVREFWSRTLRDPVGQRVVWQFLQDAHVFEERFACGPNGFPEPEATAYERGKRDLAFNLYLTLSKFDRGAVLAMHDKFDPRFEIPRQRRKS